MNAPENIVDRCVESYGRLKHLKLVGEEIGIPWQTVYIHLKASGVAVTGDKSRYGSDKDRLAERAAIKNLVDDVPVCVFQELNRKINERGLCITILAKGEMP